MSTSSALEGKVAVVTGASSGMGRAISVLLARQGAKIVCCDLFEKPNPKGFEKDLHLTTPQLVEQLGSSAIFQKVDISVIPEIEAAFEKALEVCFS